MERFCLTLGSRDRGGDAYVTLHVISSHLFITILVGPMSKAASSTSDSASPETLALCSTASLVHGACVHLHKLPVGVSQYHGNVHQDSDNPGVQVLP